MVTHFLLLPVCFGGFVLVEGQTLNQSMTLMADILTGYDRRHRPIDNQSMPIQVNVTFDIVALQDFDEVAERFSVGGLMYIVWVDERITWSPADYGGITSQLYQLPDIWYPVLVLGNPYGSVDDVAAKWMTVRYYFNGVALFSPGAVFKATCSVDVTYYPFDKQTCYLIFTPWGYNTEEMNLVSTRKNILQTYFSENGEWTIINTSAHTYDNFLWFGFELKRKPSFLVVNVLLPIIFMACINVFTFLLPAESGERISYSITCLLAIAVFLTLVSDNLPKTSKPMSIMCYYLMIILVTSTLICLTAILNLKIFFTDAKKAVPQGCQKFVRFLSCTNGKVQHNVLDDVFRSSGREENVSDKTPEGEPSAQKCSEDTVISWPEVSYAIDRLCIIAFTVIIIIVTGVFIGVLAIN